MTLGRGAMKYSNGNCIVGGDFNVDLDCVNAFSKTINNFISNRSLARYDLTFPTASKYTNINDALNCQSTIDYFLISHISNVCQFDINDHDSNLSDHLLLHIERKPHLGPIFMQRNSDKLVYKIKIREGKENELFDYSNSLHDALSEKEGGEFWNC